MALKTVTSAIRGSFAKKKSSVLFKVLKDGDNLRLTREPSNPYDKNAILVSADLPQEFLDSLGIHESEQALGYVSAKNPNIAKFLSDKTIVTATYQGMMVTIHYTEQTAEGGDGVVNTLENSDAEHESVGQQGPIGDEASKETGKVSPQDAEREPASGGGGSSSSEDAGGE